MLTPEDREEVEQIAEKATEKAIRNIIKEWMNEQFANFGRWSLGAFAVCVFGLIAFIFVKWLEIKHGFRIEMETPK